MSELISGKEALIALANGEEVECRAYEKNWINANNNHHPLSLFFDDSFQFRLKPRTIKLNIEIEKPKEIVLCAITGAVGLVYGDLDKAKSVQEALREVFK